MKIEQVLAGTSENHIAPFLWVHGEDHERYRETIEAMHAAGIGALCIEARPHDDFNGDGSPTSDSSSRPARSLACGSGFSTTAISRQDTLTARS